MATEETLKVDLEVSYDKIANLLCSAFDPAIDGVGYWAEVEGYIEPASIAYQNDPEQVYRYMDYPLNHGGAIKIMDIETKEHYLLDLAMIKRGLETMASLHPAHFADILAENDDMTTADVLVQLALLDDIIYG